KCAGAGSGVQLPEPAVQELLEEGCSRGAQGRAFVSPPVLSTSLREPVIVVAEPLTPGGPASVEGVVLAVGSLGPRWKMTRESAQGIMDVSIVDGRGRLVAHSDPARLEGDPDVSGVKIVRQFLESKGRASSTEPFEAPGKDRVVAMLGTFARLPDDSGWGVI